MSITAVRAALETKLSGMTPTLSTAWENAPFQPVVGTPYQKCFTMAATPENPTMGDGFYREIGIFQVSLMYPLLTGPKAAADRAELIRTTFKRGTSMVSGTVTVTITRTPEISQGRVDGDRWHVPVKMQWHANINA